MIETPPEIPSQADNKTSGKQGEVANRAIRERLAQLIDESGEGCASVSRLIGRNPAYIQQFIKRGVPRRLGESDRRLLARHFRVAEALLGGPEDSPPLAPASALPPDVVPIPFLQAGPSATLLIDRHMLDRLHGDRAQLAALVIDGDSMAPTLLAGDSVLIDCSDTRTPRDGIYVIGADGGLLVKRLSVHPVSHRVTILADNPAYPGFPDCDPAAIRLVGRVIWVARALG